MYKDYIALKKCTFRTRKNGPARFLKEGDSIRVSDPSIKVPEKLFKQVGGSKGAEGDVRTKKEISKEIEDLGFEAPAKATREQLLALLEEAQASAKEDGLLD